MGSLFGRSSFPGGTQEEVVVPAGVAKVLSKEKYLKSFYKNQLIYLRSIFADIERFQKIFFLKNDINSEENRI